MDVRHVDCVVDDPEDPVKFGEYANAFRVLSSGGSDVFLDFCVYLGTENRAKIVSRIRVTPDFLRVIQSRLVSGVDAPVAYAKVGGC